MSRTIAIDLEGGEHIATIDAADWPTVKGYQWHPYPVGKYLYAAAYADGGVLLMHRLIANPPAGNVVAHINGRRLDNRQTNLRVCTRADVNHAHRVVNENSRSGIKGVITETRANGKVSYRAQFVHNGTHHRKRFTCKNKAATWVAQTRLELLGGGL